MVEKVRGHNKIVSIGGGSTIDVGKYVSYKLNIPHTAIPTTAGTGSEATKFAVFVKDGQKISLENDKLIPDSFILDAERVVTLPRLYTASSGLDALSQAIESYWSPRATSESRMYAKRAIRLASKNLWQSYQHPQSLVLRERMLKAAHYSGKAINITKTSICHAISYPLTLHYQIPHGIACSHTLPYFMKRFGFTMISPNQVKRLIYGVNARMTKVIDKDLVVKEALKSERVKNTPIKINEKEIYKSLSSNEL
jgi:alcohol dehydrogenase class IV